VTLRSQGSRTLRRSSEAVILSETTVAEGLLPADGKWRSPHHHRLTYASRIPASYRLQRLRLAHHSHKVDSHLAMPPDPSSPPPPAASSQGQKRKRSRSRKPPPPPETPPPPPPTPLHDPTTTGVLPPPNLLPCEICLLPLPVKRAIVLARPSRTVKSPYLTDVRLEDCGQEVRWRSGSLVSCILSPCQLHLVARHLQESCRIIRRERSSRRTSPTCGSMIAGKRCGEL
jgi:hypothetical protein